MKRRISILLALALVLALLPGTALAAYEKNHELHYNGRSSPDPVSVTWDSPHAAFVVWYADTGDYFELDDPNDPDEKQLSKVYENVGGQWVQRPATSAIVGTGEALRDGDYGLVCIQFYEPDGDTMNFDFSNKQYGFAFDIFANGHEHKSWELFVTGSPKGVTNLSGRTAIPEGGGGPMNTLWVPNEVTGTWKGTYSGRTASGQQLQRNIHIAIESCAQDGAIKGVAQIATPSDGAWVNYAFSGNVDFNNGKFHMQGNKILEADDVDNWDMAIFDGGLKLGSDPMTITGVVSNNNDRPFSVTRVNTTAVRPTTPAASSSDTVKIYVNGSRVYPDSDPVIINGRTLVPIRAVAEALGFQVDWNGANKSVEVHNELRSLYMTIGSSSMSQYIYDKNGNISSIKTVYADVPPRIMNGRTYLPLRAVGEGIGASVDWDGSTRSVYITGGSAG